MHRAVAVLLMALSLACACDAVPSASTDNHQPQANSAPRVTNPTSGINGTAGNNPPAVNNAPLGNPPPGDAPPDNPPPENDRPVGSNAQPPVASNNVSIGVALHGAGVDVRRDETFYVDTKESDVVRSVTVSSSQIFELEWTDCIGAAIRPGSPCSIRVRVILPGEGTFRGTVEIVADSGTASIEFQIVVAPPAPPELPSMPDTAISEDPLNDAGPEVSGQDHTDSDDDRPNRSGTDVSGRNRTGSDENPPNDTSPEVSGPNHADSDEAG